MMTSATQNRRRLRLLAQTLGVLLLAFLLHWGMTPTLRAFAAPTTAPQAADLALTGFDSPQFQSKQYAYVDLQNWHIEELSIRSGSRWGVTDLTALTGASLASGANLIGFDSPQFHSKQYAYIDKAGHIEELSITAGGQWYAADLTVLTGAPLAFVGVRLTGFDSPQFHSKQYAYLDQKWHVEELSIIAGHPWSVADLSARTGAPLSAANSDLIGFDSPLFQSKQYAYFNQQNGDVEELSIRSGGQWAAVDLSTRTGAPLTGGATLAGFNSAQFLSKQYAYFNQQNGDVEELSIRSGSQWAAVDLSTRTGAPAPSGDSSMAGFDSSQFQSKQDAYSDMRGHIEELSIRSGSQWAVTDLSTRTGAPEAAGDSRMAGFDSPQFQSKQYAYVDMNGDVEELSIVTGGQWHVVDLSRLT